LAAEPRVLIADEPVSMLDVSLRRGILELLGDLQKAGLTILYITHDLPSASYFAETIAVMYAGRIVEEGPAREVVDRPAHPYTRLLLASTPDPFADDFNQLGRALSTDQGEPPSLAALPSGCSFHPRCPHAMPVCRHSLPTLEAVGAERRVSCWLHDEAASAGEPVPFTTNQRTAG
jgi:peptide/nickel transport system ATP-binding protein